MGFFGLTENRKVDGSTPSLATTTRFSSALEAASTPRLGGINVLASEESTNFDSPVTRARSLNRKLAHRFEITHVNDPKSCVVGQLWHKGLLGDDW